MMIQGFPVWGGEGPLSLFRVPIFANNLLPRLSVVASPRPSFEPEKGQVGHFGEGFLSIDRRVVGRPAPDDGIELSDETGLSRRRMCFDYRLEGLIVLMLGGLTRFNECFEAEPFWVSATRFAGMGSTDPVLSNVKSQEIESHLTLHRV